MIGYAYRLLGVPRSDVADRPLSQLRKCVTLGEYAKGADIESLAIQKGKIDPRLAWRGIFSIKIFATKVKRRGVFC
jgi:hypothetical protein